MTLTPPLCASPPSGDAARRDAQTDKSPARCPIATCPRQPESTAMFVSAPPGYAMAYRQVLRSRAGTSRRGAPAAKTHRRGLSAHRHQHFPGSRVMQENADADVLRDLDDAFSRLAPRAARYRHATEGPDDMPSHIRAALTQTSLSIPVAEGTLLLGTWQAIYLFEHRDAPHHRSVVMHIAGE